MASINLAMSKSCFYLNRLHYLGFRIGVRAILGKPRRDRLLERGLYERLPKLRARAHSNLEILSSDELLRIIAPDGSKFLIPDDLSKCVFGEIYIERVYDKLYQPRNGDVVVDAGAHAGLFSIKAAKLIGSKGRVLSFEPHPSNYALLAHNLRINGIKNVEAINSALGDAEGYAKLHLSDSSGGHFISGSNRGHFIPVNIKRLDTVVKEYRVQRVDFIKIDVEGAESQVLKGAERTLKHHKPKLAIAAYHHPNEIIDLARWLRKMGYKLHQHHHHYLYASHPARSDLVKR